MAQKKRMVWLVVLMAAFSVSIGWHIAGSAFSLRSVHPRSSAQVRAALSRVGNVPKFSSSIKGMTVNHHLLADSLVAKMITIAARQHPKLVVIFSPNHFLVGDGWMITSDDDWDTGMGVVREDHGLVHWLRKNTTVRIDEQPFANEHGIFNLLPYIATTMPKVKILPVIFKDGTPDERIDDMVRVLNAELPPDTLIIGSLDFSHYRSKTEADKEDQSTLTVLQSMDPSRMDRAFVDSRPALRALMLFAKLRGASSYQLVSHQNSADISGKPDALSTTSYIDGVFL